MAWKNVTLIVLGLIAWGALHAYGAYLFNHDPWRGVVTAVFTGGFLAFWGLLLFFARGKFARYAERAKQQPEQPRNK